MVLQVLNALLPIFCLMSFRQGLLLGVMITLTLSLCKKETRRERQKTSGTAVTQLF